MSISRRKKDDETLQKLIEWFSVNNPFDMENEEFCDLSSGLTATSKDNITCNRVKVIGDSIQEKLDDVDLFLFN